jgi:hypothetical protein
MNGTALATSLLGRRVRLAAPPAGTETDEGVIVTVYLDAEGMHYVVLVGGRLVGVAAADQLTILQESPW